MRSKSHRLAFLVGALGLASGLSACPGSLADPGEFEEGGSQGRDGAAASDATVEAGTETGTPPPGDGGCGSQVPNTIFSPICAMVGCHNTSNVASGQLSLASPIDLASLVNQPNREDAGDFLLINTAQPAQSVLYTKLTSSPPFGIQMPYGENPLTAAQMQCVLDWIVQVSDGGTD